MATAVLTVFLGLANVAWAAVLLIGAVRPMDDASGLPIPDWLAHGAGYATQAGLLWVLLSRCHRRRAIVSSLAFLGATVLGVLTEYTQTFLPDRSAELRDIVADTVGAVLMIAALETVRHFRRNPPGGGIT